MTGACCLDVLHAVVMTWWRRLLCDVSAHYHLYGNPSNALYFSRALIPHSKSGAFSPETTTYLRHVGLYAFRTRFLLQFPSLPVSPLEASEDLEQLRVLSAGHKIKIVQVDATLPGVDTREELDALKAQWPVTAPS